jgi:uncharacterized protein (DUF608 family)
MKKSFISLLTVVLSVITGSCFAQPLVTHNIPADKGLDPLFIKSLYERGTPTIYAKSRNELRYIGMPAGGITAGGVYLGGDGRLWLWDIFNDNREGIQPKYGKWQQDTKADYVVPRNGGCYVEPAQNVRPLEQGFIFRFEYDGKTVVKYQKASDWDDVHFEAGYPVATVRYFDNDLPVEVTLRAYSPFIPLNEDDSGLPATIQSFSFKNTGTAPVKISVLGWLENKTGITSGNEIRGDFGALVSRRSNTISKRNGIVAVDESLFAVMKADELQNCPDYGTMCIAALNTHAQGYAAIDLDDISGIFDSAETAEAEKPISEALVGAVQSVLNIPVNASANAEFIISWYFPNLKIYDNIPDRGRYYQNRFTSALEVAQYIQRDFSRLSSQTLLWADTWTDSTFPYWFLERTFMNINTLATTNCHRFNTGRFWAWEGVGACAGTCTHVWQYAQAMGRIFPALERDCRERTDLGISLMPDGGIRFRAEVETRPAIIAPVKRPDVPS